MTLLEVVGTALGGGAFVKALDVGHTWLRQRRAAKAGDSKVAVAEIGAGTTALHLLAEEVDDLRELVKSERTECRAQIGELRAEIAELKRAGEDCEKRAKSLQVQLNRLRSWMRTDPSEREELTPVEVPGKERNGR